LRKRSHPLSRQRNRNSSDPHRYDDQAVSNTRSLSLDLSFLPAVNASLNAIAIVLLVRGVWLIKRGRIDEHKRMMLAACICSCAFLVSYVIHYVWRATVHGGTHTKFNAEGAIKLAYYLMLFSHIMLATTVPVFAVWLIRLGLRREDRKHRRLARWAYPIWLYVSITGVLIFVVLTFFNQK